MARAVKLDAPTIRLALSAQQKINLQNLAAKCGQNSISSFIGAIGDGKVRVIDEDAYTLLEWIKDMSYDRRINYVGMRMPDGTTATEHRHNPSRPETPPSVK